MCFYRSFLMPYQVVDIDVIAASSAPTTGRTCPDKALRLQLPATRLRNCLQARLLPNSEPIWLKRSSINIISKLCTDVSNILFTIQNIPNREVFSQQDSLASAAHAQPQALPL